MANLEFPLTTEIFRERVFKQMREDDLSGNGAAFFSQFHIGSDGKLSRIIDPTIAKDVGDHVLEEWNRHTDLVAGFRLAYARASRLQELLVQSLPGEKANLNLSEVVFTYQRRQVSEGWHLDWYPTEYLIGTQTFVAKRFSRERSQLEDAMDGGTEYLLSQGTGHRQEIEFRVNKTEPITVRSSGYPFTTPTGLLALHSGTTRAIQFGGASAEYDAVSPPHRGSQSPLEYRASIAIRFSSRSAELDSLEPKLASHLQ
jgi:hypothetical protein